MYTEQTHTLPFKSLGPFRNVLVFERKATFLSIKIDQKNNNQIDQKYSLDIVNVMTIVAGNCRFFYGIST
jgi:hypothetical protein